MKTASFLFASIAVGCMLFVNISFGQDSTKIADEEVITWLRQNSIPIKYTEAGNNFSDLNPLKMILKGVRVIGLGEATHGTREFFQLKHRLMEFLVEEMDFTAFIIESSFSACQPINDYILTGKGDRATVLTGQGYTAWDTEEFSAMLEWMRTYNQKVTDEKKIRFYGMDLCFNGLGRERVLTYLKKYAPEKIPYVDSLFEVLASEEEKWPTRLDQGALQKAFIPLQKLIDYLTIDKEKLISLSSLDEWEKVYQHTQVMNQWVLANLKDSPPSLIQKKLSRVEYVGQNLLYIIDKEKANTKFMVWAHNSHIATTKPEKDSLRRSGYQLRTRLGDKYFALALECNQGTFQARALLPDQFWGELKVDTISSLQKSINWYLLSTNKGNQFIDLRSAHSNAMAKKWMETPQKIGAGVYLSRRSSKNQTNIKLKDTYDGILFIERSTPVYPTKNAKNRSSNKIGF